MCTRELEVAHRPKRKTIKLTLENRHGLELGKGF